jgi:hypothetical protein
VSRFKKTGLYLTGGLGNQLFQFAAALSYSQSGKIELFEKFGKPRLNSKGEPEIFSLTVEEIASVSRRAEDNLLLRKSSGYLLRSRIWPRKLEKFIIIQVLTDLAASAIQSINFRDFFYPISISDVGYRRIKMNRFVRWIFNPILIGYFQTSVWPQEIKVKLQFLKLKQEGPEIVRLRAEASVQRPVVIHIRRGDYKSESTFGLLG